MTESAFSKIRLGQAMKRKQRWASRNGAVGQSRLRKYSRDVPPYVMEFLCVTPVCTTMPRNTAVSEGKQCTWHRFLHFWSSSPLVGGCVLLQLLRSAMQCVGEDPVEGA